MAARSRLATLMAVLTASRLGVFASGYPLFTPVYCGTTTPSGPPVDTTSAPGLRYDPDAGQYVYVWQTSRRWAGTCGRLEVRLAGGTSPAAYFRFT